MMMTVTFQTMYISDFS